MDRVRVYDRADICTSDVTEENISSAYLREIRHLKKHGVTSLSSVNHPKHRVMTCLSGNAILRSRVEMLNCLEVSMEKAKRDGGFQCLTPFSRASGIRKCRSAI